MFWGENLLVLLLPPLLAVLLLQHNCLSSFRDLGRLSDGKIQDSKEIHEIKFQKRLMARRENQRTISINFRLMLSRTIIAAGSNTELVISATLSCSWYAFSAEMIGA